MTGAVDIKEVERALEVGLRHVRHAEFIDGVKELITRDRAGTVHVPLHKIIARTSLVPTLTVSSRALEQVTQGEFIEWRRRQRLWRRSALAAAAAAAPALLGLASLTVGALLAAMGGAPRHREAAVRPALEGNKSAEKATEDPSKMLEQVTALRHQAAKRRDALKAEVEDMRAHLAAKEEHLAGYERDVGSLQLQMAQLLAGTAGASPTLKRAGEPPQGLVGVKNALKMTEAELQTPEYSA